MFQYAKHLFLSLPNPWRSPLKVFGAVMVMHQLQDSMPIASLIGFMVRTLFYIKSFSFFVFCRSSYTMQSLFSCRYNACLFLFSVFTSVLQGLNFHPFRLCSLYQLRKNTHADELYVLFLFYSNLTRHSDKHSCRILSATKKCQIIQ